MNHFKLIVKSPYFKYVPMFTMYYTFLGYQIGKKIVFENKIKNYQYQNKNFPFKYACYGTICGFLYPLTFLYSGYMIYTANSIIVNIHNND